MDAFLSFFDVNNTFFTFLNYPISYLELTGTVFNLLSVWLVAKRNIWTWPVSVVAVILFGILFYQIQLYADFFEQIYYFITGIWGWYLWQTSKEKDQDSNKVLVTKTSSKEGISWLGGSVMASIALIVVLSNINIWLPSLFPEPASLVVLDATTTIASFIATILMIKRRLESWLIWIAVDVIAVGLYWYKEVPFIAMLYFVFLIIATRGYFGWKKAYVEESEKL